MHLLFQTRGDFNMETMETIKRRRSIRKYTSQPVDEDDLIPLIRAAMYAPSAGNQQPWEFIIIDDNDLLEEFAIKHSNAHMLSETPAAVLICADLSRLKHDKFWVQDCAAACQNFLLAAHDRGLATCWVGVYPRENRVSDIRKMLKLPDQIVPFSLIPVGKPDETLPVPDRFDSSRIHKNSWK